MELSRPPTKRSRVDEQPETQRYFLNHVWTSGRGGGGGGPWHCMDPEGCTVGLDPNK